MKKNIFGLTVGAMLFALCFPAEAQQPAKLPKIGWLGVRPAASDTGREIFRRELRAVGYVEGKNIVLEYRTADDNLDRLPALANELIRLKVDVLLASTTPAAVAAQGRYKDDLDRLTAAGKTGWWIRVNMANTAASNIALQVGTSKNDRREWRIWTATDPIDFDLPSSLLNASELYVRARSNPGKDSCLCVFY
jgi:ABC-type uncharacterized transport system substrate-binding protein